MFDHLTDPALVDLRARMRRYVEEELVPLERELGRTPRRPPREVLQGVWRRSSELGFYQPACRWRWAGRA